MKSLKVNAALNTIKQFCSIIFPFISIPYVSRVLQSENYGKYNFGNSVISYFSLIAALGIVSYAVREGSIIRDKKKDFSDFCNQVFTINVCATILSYLLLMILFFRIEKLHSYRTLIWIQSIVILFTTLGADWVNSIFEEFKYITIRYIVLQCISLAALFLFVKKPSDYIIYACITVFASAGANILNIFHIRKFAKLRLTMHINIKKHLPPLIFLFCNTIAVTIYVNSDTTMLGFLVNDSAVGAYSLSAKIYTIVKQLLSAIIIVTLPRFSAYVGNSKINEYQVLLFKVKQALISILFPAIVGLFMLSDQAVLIAGGSDYGGGALPLRILSLALLFAVLGHYYSNCIMLPYKMEKQFLYATIAGAIINIILNIFAIPKYGATGAAMTTVIAEFIVCSVCYYFSRRYIQIKMEKKFIISVICACSFIVGICGFVTHCLGIGVLPAAIAVAICVIAYAVIMLMFKNEIIMQIFAKFKDKVIKR